MEMDISKLRRTRSLSIHRPSATQKSIHPSIPVLSRSNPGGSKMCDSSKKCGVLSAFTCDKKKSKDDDKSTLEQLLHQTKLLKKSGDGLTPVLDVDGHLSRKVVALYFSAHWCPPCRQFTPILKMFYEEVGDSEFEIIFLSKDHSKDEYNEYFKEEHGNWCTVPFEDPLVEKLQNRYEVKSVPTLVIVKHNGEAVVKNAWSTVQNASKSPKELFAQWKGLVEKK